MEEIIRQLEHTIEYFKDAQTDFQRGRVFEAEKILQALRIHDVVGRSEQLVCVGCGRTEKQHTGNGKDICPNNGGQFKAN
jgi:hypothetical protein